MRNARLDEAQAGIKIAGRKLISQHGKRVLTEALEKTPGLSWTLSQIN